MRHETGTLVGRGGTRLFWQSWHPEGDSIATVVNQHGLGDHGGLYPTLVDRLTDASMSVFALDLRGHGRSAGQRGYLHDWRDYLDDLDAFIEFVGRQDSRPIFLLGNSLGGLLALDYALERPGRLAGVIAAAPAIGPLGVPRGLMMLGRILSRVWPRFSLATGLNLGGLSRDPAAARAVMDDPLFHRRGTARLSTEVPKAIARVQERAPALAVPVLLLHGTADRIVSPVGSRAFFDRVGLADKALMEYPGGYHALFADLDHSAVLDDVIAWIRRHLA